MLVKILKACVPPIIFNAVRKIRGVSPNVLFDGDDSLSMSPLPSITDG